MSGVCRARAVKLFDAHCHLQDARISAVAPQLIRAALDSGVTRFAVNGVSEKDWYIVKQMAEEYPSIIPCFGLHPWFVAERSPNWFTSLKAFFADTPTAAVGEIGLDKGSHGKNIEFGEQVEVFQEQLELAKELERPVSVHCVRAFGDLLDILKCTGPFPAGVILHSYLGSAEMVAGLANFNCYFSFSGFLMTMKKQKAKKMVPLDRILIETDAPDALPKLNSDSLLEVPTYGLNPEEPQNQHKDTGSEPTKDALNHPANIHRVLDYVAMLLEMPAEELAELSCRNATRLFSYPGSKVHS
ncbi:uncharacterized protein [Typha latifolia]|uniref:uncharacterized protein isoform X2 n=1 Tax=Typha latifolia TaxID=4733 RepID=UPI003C30DE63